MKYWKKFLALLLVAVMLVLAAVPAFAEKDGDKKETEEKKIAANETLDLWAEDSEAAKMLVDYVEAVTDKDGEEFIPEADRIAVFDLDGTLFCETDPIYLEWLLFVKRAMFDETYEATDEEKQLARDIVEAAVTGVFPEDLEMRQILAETEAFAGMPLNDYLAYLDDIFALPAFGYENMAVGEAFYKPMLQVVDYLKENDFTVYIVSGSGRTFVRELAVEACGLPRSQVIGTDTLIIASGQGDAGGYDYTYTKEDELVLSNELILKNVKSNKITQIMEHIGVKPVLSFGNSSGDIPMAEFTCWDNQYDAMAFMLCCDDLERENGNEKKAAKMEASCIELGFVPVSMKNDFLTIYGDGVVKKDPVELDKDTKKAVDQEMAFLDKCFSAKPEIKPTEYAGMIVSAYKDGKLTEDDLKQAILMMYEALAMADEEEEPEEETKAETGEEREEETEAEANEEESEEETEAEETEEETKEETKKAG
ncbi:MAG: haloacid dehalogenase-like hydrolase [Lachnospiraceae bacterium]|nr:haloacid dehalogenase-like hydrolase [Lachnospiraceae bacterium]